MCLTTTKTCCARLFEMSEQLPPSNKVEIKGSDVSTTVCCVTVKGLNARTNKLVVF